MIAVCVLCAAAYMTAQPKELSGRIHIPLWAHLEAYPGVEEDVYSETAPFAYPVSRLRRTAPFIIEGMVYGWRFAYAPYDRARGTEEYFELEPVRSIAPEAAGITYSKPWIEGSRLYCWVDFVPDPYTEKARGQWASGGYPKIHGRGAGSLFDGFDGIAAACRNAAKDAVREYMRTIEKNKPQEITGTLLLTGSPQFGVESGRYMAVLDFFLDVDTIKKYRY